MKINSLARTLSLLGIVTISAGLALGARSNTMVHQDKASESLKKGDELTFVRRAGSIPKFSTSIESPLIPLTFAAQISEPSSFPSSSMLSSTMVFIGITLTEH